MGITIDKKPAVRTAVPATAGGGATSNKPATSTTGRRSLVIPTAPTAGRGGRHLGGPGGARSKDPMECVLELLEFLPPFSNDAANNSGGDASAGGVVLPLCKPPTVRKANRLALKREMEEELRLLTIEEAEVMRIQKDMPPPPDPDPDHPVLTPIDDDHVAHQSTSPPHHRNQHHLNASLEAWVTGLEQLLLRPANLDMLRCLSACQWDVEESWAQYMNPTYVKHREAAGRTADTTGTTASADKKEEGIGPHAATTGGGDAAAEKEEVENLFLFAPETFYDSADILLMILSFSSSNTFFNSCGVSKRWHHVSKRMFQARCMAFDAAFNFRKATLKMGFWPTALCECDVRPGHTKAFLKALNADRVVPDGKSTTTTADTRNPPNKYDGENGGAVWPMFSLRQDALGNVVKKPRVVHTTKKSAEMSKRERKNARRTEVAAHDEALANIYGAPTELAVFNLNTKEGVNSDWKLPVSSAATPTPLGTPARGEESSEHIITFFLGRSPTQSSGARVQAATGGLVAGSAPAHISYPGAMNLERCNVPVFCVKGVMLGGAQFRHKLHSTLYKTHSSDFDKFFQMPDDPTKYLKVLLEKVKREELAALEAAKIAEARWVSQIHQDLLWVKRRQVERDHKESCRKSGKSSRDGGPKRQEALMVKLSKCVVTQKETETAVKKARADFERDARAQVEEAEAKRKYLADVKSTEGSEHNKEVAAAAVARAAGTATGVPDWFLERYPYQGATQEGLDINNGKPGFSQDSLVALVGGNASYYQTKLDEYRGAWRNVHATRHMWEEFAFSLPAPTIFRNHVALGNLANQVRDNEVTPGTAELLMSAIKEQTLDKMRNKKPVDLMAPALNENQLLVLGEMTHRFVVAPPPPTSANVW